MRKSLFSGLFAALAAIASLATIASIPASAQTTVLSAPNYHPNIKTLGIVTMAAGTYTNSTTTPSDIGLAVTLPATSLAYTQQVIEVCYSLAAGKATATTGTVSVLFNGTADTTFSRSIGTAGLSMNGCFWKVRPTASAVAIKLQGVSGDTNAFTVTQGQIKVSVFYTLIQ